MWSEQRESRREPGFARSRPRAWNFALVAMIGALSLAACRHEPEVAEKAVVRQANVQRIEVVVLDSEPAQVRVVAYGYLPDGCTTVAGISQTRDDRTFRAVIRTTRPAAALCTQMIIRFQETFPLDVGGLPAGAYTVDVNGVTGAFTLPADVPR